MKTLTSRSNPLYKQWLSDLRQAGRRGQAAWLEGVHLCEAWLQHCGQPTWALFSEEHMSEPEIAALMRAVDESRHVWMPAKLLAGLSSMASAPAVMFVGEVPVPLADSGLSKLSRNCVLLDDIQDPGNVGTILRTVAAAGIREVYTGPATAACWSPKVLRAGQGAQFALSIHEAVDLRALLKAQADQVGRLPVLVTSLHLSAQSLFCVALPEAAIWVFGHEGRGVSNDLVELADQCLFIEHDRAAVESLNVASAAAICLFEQRRQHLRNA